MLEEKMESEDVAPSMTPEYLANEGLSRLHKANF